MTHWLLRTGLGVIATASLATAQPTTQPVAVPAASDQLQCAFQRKDHPDYILWVCNPEGTATSLEGSVLWLRKNAAGAEVLTSVWHGSSTEMVKRSESIITSHTRENSGCRYYVHLARAQRRRVAWNLGTPSMIGALRMAGRGNQPRGCYTAEPGAADFIVLWGETADALPNAFTVDIPTTAHGADLPGRQPDRTPEPVANTVTVNVHRVEPGMDNTVLRLGLTVFAAGPVVAPSAAEPVSPVERALKFLAQGPS
jgi:hypothetical protein